MLKMVRNFFQERFNYWLSKRIPPANRHYLTSKNIFIFPTRFGFAYIAFVLILFLLGTNYQNNIIILVSFLLASFFITAMLHSFNNFSGLVVVSDSVEKGFAEQDITFRLTLLTDKPRFDLHAQFANKQLASSKVKLMDCQTDGAILLLRLANQRRGERKLGRVRISSEYAFGLFKSWSVLDFGHKVIVYPKRLILPNAQYQMTGIQQDDGVSIYSDNVQVGHDDFAELKSFVLGESLSRTAWKQLAKGQGHYSKHYQESQGSPRWLKLSDMPEVSLEKKLSYLAYLICELTQDKQSFGLLLDGGMGEKAGRLIEPATGSKHQEACLTALAYYTC